MLLLISDIYVHCDVLYLHTFPHAVFSIHFFVTNLVSIAEAISSKSTSLACYLCSCFFIIFIVKTLLTIITIRV